MALWAVKYSGLGSYLKPGYNVLKRFQRGDKPDDTMDCCMVVGSFKHLKDAERAAKKEKGIIEIREHKIQDK